MQDLIQQEFDPDWNWICPDVKSITLNKDVFKLKSSEATSFVMVVNKCSDAKSIDEANGLISYTTAECDEQAEADVWKLEVFSKLLTQNEDPVYFEQ